MCLDKKKNAVLQTDEWISRQGPSDGIFSLFFFPWWQKDTKIFLKLDVFGKYSYIFSKFSAKILRLWSKKRLTLQVPKRKIWVGPAHRTGFLSP